MDTFADIAAKGIYYRDANLIEPQPPILEERYLQMEQSDTAGFQPMEKINTKEKLEDELVKQRAYYKEFLQDMAPDLPSYRIRTYVETFDWRIQTREDQQDFCKVLQGDGKWEKVHIPHYGAPVGKATTYYRTTIHISKEQLNIGAIFIGFKGVDYKTKVFVNGSFVGSHEGFFAPFELDMTSYVKIGENTLVVRVENDFICMGNATPDSEGIQYTGEKIYAATGPGYDDVAFGWHHCPSGMGIYQEVYVEARPRIHIKDIFVRPLPEERKAEAWIEVFNCDVQPKDIMLTLSLFGQNFQQEVFTDFKYKPTSHLTVGVGDSLTEAKMKAEGKLNQSIPLHMEKGVNRLRIGLDIPDAKIWEMDTPWLYQLQVKLVDTQNELIDNAKQQFGMRSFRMDENSDPKGMFYLNGKKIRLRGANTMGHEQQCVMKKDWEQLIDDILLAKISNMNFLRLTQRPVQPEVYAFCDKLGLMTQTDLPLFGMLRRSQFCEAIKQVEEMERLVRSHPCNVIISYINEPFPNAGNKPHLNLTRDELMDFFKGADLVVRLNNPDRVIKSIDGDYDPPTEGLPDNHCYPGWYNGHGIDMGRLVKGYWMKVKPGWHYGCGEFGAEGLDPVNVMEKYYPKHWLPESKEQEENWSPNRIVGAQTGKFGYMFYDIPNAVEEWVKASQEHQAWVTYLMTEAFRRDSRMNTFAIHLFIDAFPSGWMKTIMDVDRQPKPAYFAYRDALTPLMVSLRTDRYKFVTGEDIKLEAWICHDKEDVSNDCMLHYQVIKDGKIIGTGKEKANIPECSSAFQGFIQMNTPEVDVRTQMTVQLGLINGQGKIIHDTSMDIEVFPSIKPCVSSQVCSTGIENGKANSLIKELGIQSIELEEVSEDDVILIDDYAVYKENEETILKAVKHGSHVVFLELPAGEYSIDHSEFVVKPCGMLPVHFASRKTDHPLVEGLHHDDFKIWHDPDVDYITPLMETTFIADDFTPILTSGNIDTNGEWNMAMAAAEKTYGQGKIIICQIKLARRTTTNPIAHIFAKRLLKIK